MFEQGDLVRQLSTTSLLVSQSVTGSPLPLSHTSEVPMAGPVGGCSGEVSCGEWLAGRLVLGTGYPFPRRPLGGAGERTPGPTPTPRHRGQGVTRMATPPLLQRTQCIVLFRSYIVNSGRPLRLSGCIRAVSSRANAVRAPP